MANPQRLLKLTLASHITAETAKIVAKNANQADNVAEIAEQAIEKSPIIANGLSEIGAKIISKVGCFLKESGGNINKVAHEIVDTVKELSESVKKGNQAIPKEQMTKNNFAKGNSNNNKRGLNYSEKQSNNYNQMSKAIEYGKPYYNTINTLGKGGNTTI